MFPNCDLEKTKKANVITLSFLVLDYYLDDWSYFRIIKSSEMKSAADIKNNLETYNKLNLRKCDKMSSKLNIHTEIGTKFYLI